MKEIKLTKGFTTLVDDEDFDELNRFKWFALTAGKSVYAARNEMFFERPLRKRKIIKMHKYLLPNKKFVDHKNGNSLDNRRHNLREVTKSQNGRNRRAVGASKYIGVALVHFGKYERKWGASIRIDGKKVTLGHHASEVEAAKAYNDAAVRFGVSDYCRLNQF